MTEERSGADSRDELVRFIKNGKTYFYPKKDLQRRLQRKIDRLARTMPDVRKQAFLKVTDALSAAIDWSKAHEHIASKLSEKQSPYSGQSPYHVNETINKLLKLVARGVKTMDISSASRIELAQNAGRAAHSICKLFDRAADCWKQNWETIVRTHAN